MGNIWNIYVIPCYPTQSLGSELQDATFVVETTMNTTHLIHNTLRVNISILTQKHDIWTFLGLIRTCVRFKVKPRLKKDKIVTF